MSPHVSTAGRRTARRGLAALGTAALASLAVTGLAAAPAAAAGHHVYTAYDSVVAGKAQFHSYGDYFTLDDLLSDGSGVTLLYKRAGGETESMYWPGGSSGGGASRYENYKEGSTLYFKVCDQNGQHGKLTYCGDWVKGTA
ncbi:hypothetical protein ABZ820_29635 [Streptomyces diacarni]|uniref:hypothetical protein n=1 Tax=Streptomyces diacarni TaxID=2800381 RepID=UPI0034086660